MKKEPPTNIAASIRQRLLNLAKSENRPFNELLQYYAMERFLYRLSKSSHAERFILKGALMLRAWHSPETRPTMDIDMLGITTNAESSIIAQIKDILHVEAEPDGICFDADSIQTERIMEEADYEGIRVRFRATLDSARINMQIDIGFGDAVWPTPEKLNLPAMLDFPAPRLLCYSRESVIAEKFEVMLKRGELNSRMKDFYDIWLLSQSFGFDGSLLTEAIRLTLERRARILPPNIAAFTPDFAQAKQSQWTAFRNRLQHTDVPPLFTDVIDAIAVFIAPITMAITGNTPAPHRWPARGPWT